MTSTVAVKPFSGADRILYPIRYQTFHKVLEAYIAAKYQLADAVLSAFQYDNEAKRPTNRYLLVEFVADVESSISEGIGDDDELWRELHPPSKNSRETQPERIPEKAKQKIVTLVGKLFCVRRLDPAQYFLKD